MKQITGRLLEYGVRHPDGSILIVAVAGSLMITIAGIALAIDTSVLFVIMLVGILGAWSLHNHLTSEAITRNASKRRP